MDYRGIIGDLYIPYNSPINPLYRIIGEVRIGEL